MKRLVTILILAILTLPVLSQDVVKLTDGEPAIIPNYLIIQGNLYFYDGSQYTSLGDSLLQFVSKGDSAVLFFTPRQVDSALYASNYFDGTRPITRTSWPSGEILGGYQATDVLNNLLYPSVGPTATLSQTLASPQEYMAGGADLTTDLNYSVTRPTACLEITDITVDGGVTLLDSPFDEGHTQSGTYTNRLVPRNTPKTFTLVANSTDKSVTRTTSITWSWKRYWGTSVDQTISDADILALTGAGVGSGSEFATNRVKSYDGIDGAGNYLVFAFPSSFGTPVFIINGLTSTAFTKVRDDAFINASGGTTNYQIWVSNSAMNSPINSFNIQ
jgi:hypothetical protein